MRTVFFRCIHGHFYRNNTCPYDGWSCEAFLEIEGLFKEDDALTIEQLRAQGVGDDVLENILIIEHTSGCNVEGVIVRSYATPSRTTWLDDSGRECESPLVSKCREAEESRDDPME